MKIYQWSFLYLQCYREFGDGITYYFLIEFIYCINSCSRRSIFCILGYDRFKCFSDTMFLLIIILVYRNRRNENGVGYEAFVPGKRLTFWEMSDRRTKPMPKCSFPSALWRLLSNICVIFFLGKLPIYIFVTFWELRCNLW